ncbi:hypothetical protein ACF06P_08970 [Streptomyces sp. NPDC015684]|uniref:hypothetical protein n=1 Tax=Streptomyces sp. NPDC015684 TaxID=3364963 RepID=UPI0036F7177B
MWANWLCGEHKPHHRRRVLDEFSQGIAADGTVVEKTFLGSVRVLGEGIDTSHCDSVCSGQAASGSAASRCGCEDHFHGRAA